MLERRVMQQQTSPDAPANVSQRSGKRLPMHRAAFVDAAWCASQAFEITINREFGVGFSL